MHPDGYIEIKDRSKDIIISGGENISTIEVESVLYRHPAVLEAAVVARPDETWGETPCAFVTLKPGAAATADGDHRLLPRAPGALQGAAHRRIRAACPRPRPARCKNISCAIRPRHWPERGVRRSRFPVFSELRARRPPPAGLLRREDREIQHGNPEGWEHLLIMP